MSNNLILQLFCYISCLLSIGCQDIPINETIFVCPVEDEPESSQRPIRDIQPEVRQRRSITVELGVFYEEYALSNFGNDTRKFENHIKIILMGAQAVLNYPSLLTRVNLVVNRVEKLPSSQVATTNNSYDYRDSFCEWQYRTYNLAPKRKNYDLALLLVHTGIYNRNNVINEG